MDYLIPLAKSRQELIQHSQESLLRAGFTNLAPGGAIYTLLVSVDVNPSFDHYAPAFRKPLLEVGAFSDPLWHCGMSQVSGASAYTADNEWSASGGDAVLAPEAIGPDKDWMVDLDLRFDMALAHAAGKDSGLPPAPGRRPFALG